MAISLLTVATLIATSVLAITAFFSFRESKKQVKTMEKQLSQSIKNRDPHLKINNFKFNGNNLDLNIENIGESMAYDIALMSSVFLYETKDGGKFFIPKSNYELYDEDIKVVDMLDGIIFSYENYNRTYAEPKKSRDMRTTPFFFIKYLENTKNLRGRGLSVEDLIKFSKTNNFRYVLMSCSLIYKNSLSMTLPPLHICSFIIDLETDSSLEVAYNEKRKFGGNAIPISEIGKQTLVIPYDDYKNLNFNP